MNTVQIQLFPMTQFKNFLEFLFRSSKEFKNLNKLLLKNELLTYFSKIMSVYNTTIFIGIDTKVLRPN